uniref:Uncharacterized protein n=1 Tax=Physcomitrium patens TaxID=3218 RepID=A0A2K1J3K5_PHYPA|nr:hypothetical protein PHYPA_021951 [Physcomitrium patens]
MEVFQVLFNTGIKNCSHLLSFPKVMLCGVQNAQKVISSQFLTCSGCWNKDWPLFFCFLLIVLQRSIIKWNPT